MSDDDIIDEKPPGKKPSNGEKTLVEPIVTDQAFFDWLEGLFYATPEVTHFPEFVDCRLVSGRHLEKFGPYIKKVAFAPSSASEEAAKKMPGKLRKPSKEDLVRMSNEWLFAMQKDCDEGGKAQTYGCHAWHFSTADEPYSRIIRRFKPLGRHSIAGRGYSDPGNNEEDDEESETDKLEKRLSVQMMRHNESMYAMSGTAFAGMFDRQDRLISRVLDRNDKLETKNEHLMEMLERSLSMENEREANKAWTEMKIKAGEKALELVTQLGPPMLSAALSKPGQPSTASDTLETLTLRNFFKAPADGGQMTMEQGQAAFGVWSEPPDVKLIKPGALSGEQASLLFSIAHGHAPVDNLDHFMPGGSLAISMEQLAALREIFPIEQLTPLIIIFNGRRAKKSIG